MIGPASVVAHVIADGLENPGSPLRLPAGADAGLVITTRGRTDDATFQAGMHTAPGPTW